MLRGPASISCLLIALGALAACDPPGSGGGGGSSPTPSPSPECTPAANQTNEQVVYDCSITRTLGNVMFDPVDDSNTECTPFSLTNPQSNEERDSRLLTLSSQTFTSPALRFTYGTGGDDGEARVRVDIALGAGTTHTAQLGKTPRDCSVPGANVPVTMTFTGTHVALIDKTQTPMCVFESRYTPGSFNLAVGPGGPNAPDATRKKIEKQIERQLDLEAARRVNGLLSSTTALDDAFVDRSGRCPDSYEPFG